MRVEGGAAAAAAGRRAAAGRERRSETAGEGRSGAIQRGRKHEAQRWLQGSIRGSGDEGHEAAMQQTKGPACSTSTRHWPLLQLLLKRMIDADLTGRREMRRR